MDKSYIEGDLLQLQTIDSEVIEGRFFSMTDDKSKISLYNVKDSIQEGVSENVCHYYDSEVSNIVKLPDSEKPAKLKISPKENEDIIMVSEKFIYINHIDNTFHEAIKDMNQYSYIGVSTDGANMGRKFKMPILVMSTPHQIYIFDIQVMQCYAFEAGLRQLLEGDTPKKIIHDCRNLSDCLYHKHDVKLNSVFDTQIGDLIISKNKTGDLPSTVNTLAECLHNYLGVQPNFIAEKLVIHQFTERPLSSQIKKSLAKNIAFLHRLSEIIHNELMVPFTRGVEYYVENLRSCDDFKAWELCGKRNQLSEDFRSAINY